MRQAFKFNTCEVLLSFLIMTNSFSYASEKDWLSGEYTIFLSESQKEEYPIQDTELPIFKVKKINQGWAEQHGEELELTDASTEHHFYAEAFPQNQNDNEMQCGLSGSIILCHMSLPSDIEGLHLTLVT